MISAHVPYLNFLNPRAILLQQGIQPHPGPSSDEGLPGSLPPDGCIMEVFNVSHLLTHFDNLVNRETHVYLVGEHSMPAGDAAEI